MKTKKLLKLLDASIKEIKHIIDTAPVIEVRVSEDKFVPRKESALKDPNEKYNTVQENVINILIQYDERVRDTHKDLIQVAENMVKNTPIEFRKREDNEPMKHYRYTTSPAFKRVADILTSYIMTNTKD